MRAGVALLACAWSAASAWSASAGAQPRPEPPDSAPRPFVVAPGASRAPGHIAVKVSGHDNGGAMAVLEVPTTPGQAPALHVHHVENEWFYVLDGEYLFRVGGEVVRLKPGASVYGPKRIPHTWRDVGRGPGRLLVVAQPAGHIEAFTRDLEALTAAGPPSPDAYKALFARHDMELAGPPLPKPSDPP